MMTRKDDCSELGDHVPGEIVALSLLASTLGVWVIALSPTDLVPIASAR